VEAVAFSPDGQLLATGGQDGIARLWRLGSDAESVALGAQPNGWVVAVAFSPDGRALLTATRDVVGISSALRLWDVATGRERARFAGHQGTAGSVAFSGDGRRIASGGGDGAVLLWDVTGRLRDGALMAADLPPPRLETEWMDLVADDAFRAHQAAWALASAPSASLPLLREFLKPVPRGEGRRIAQLVKDLDDDDFEVRERASAELGRIGEPAGPALRRALGGTPSAEVRSRASRLLEGFAGRVPSADRLRQERALEVLEHIGNTEARSILKGIAQGEPGAGLTRQAKAALERLGKGAVGDGAIAPDEPPAHRR
jgi:hypothetical protein